MSGRNTVEYRTANMNSSKLLLSFNNNVNLIELTHKLTSLELLNREQGRAIRNRHIGVLERASDLVDTIFNKIEENKVNYHKLIQVLRECGATYKEVIRNLESTYHEVNRELEEDLARVEKAGILHSHIIIANYLLYSTCG